MRKKGFILALFLMLLIGVYGRYNIYAQNNEKVIFEENKHSYPENISIKLNSSSKAILSELEFKAEGLIVSDKITSRLISSDNVFKVKIIPKIYVNDTIYTSFLQTDSDKSLSDIVYADNFNELRIGSIDNKYPNEISNAIGIYDSGNKLLLAISPSAELYFESSTLSPVEVFGKKYKGALKFISNSSNISVINYINIEEYLKGVVAKEMPASWSIEALKAQAVAARSFTYSNYNKYINSGYNLTDDTRSQVYGGFSSEHENTTRAVDETKDVVAYYNGKIAQLLYNASSGGKTESSGNIWTTALPYLVAKDDPFSIGNPYDRWEFALTSSDIEKLLKNRGKDIGTLQSIAIDEITTQGYIIGITFNGSKASESFKKDSIRALFGASKLKSLYFIITANGEQYVFIGRGNGHGVGMSQYGAKAMAEQGYDYTQILGFYYPNTVLVKIR